MTDINLTAAIRPTSDAIYRQLSGQYGDFSTPSDEEAEAVLKAALPHILAQVESRVKPTREDVARVIESDAWTLSDDDYFAAYDDGMRGVGYCLQMRSGRRNASLKSVDAVLALLPGRTEQEVRAEIANISEEAAMDLWWEACNDGWAVPDYLPLKYLKHVIWALDKYGDHAVRGGEQR